MDRIRKILSCPKERGTSFWIDINESDRRNCLQHCLSECFLEMSSSLCRYHRSQLLVKSESFSDSLCLNFWKNWSEKTSQKFSMS